MKKRLTKKAIKMYRTYRALPAAILGGMNQEGMGLVIDAWTSRLVSVSVYFGVGRKSRDIKMGMMMPRGLCAVLQPELDVSGSVWCLAIENGSGGLNCSGGLTVTVSFSEPRQNAQSGRFENMGENQG